MINYASATLNFRQFSSIITGFDKEIHSISINDDDLWQKDAILNWTLHSISWTAFRVHKTIQIL